MSLKICYLLPRLLPAPSGEVVGGSAANCVSLARELRCRGVSVELLAPIPAESLPSFHRHPLAECLRPLPYVGKSLVGRGLATIRILRRGLQDVLRQSRFDVVHSHSGIYPYALAALAADRRTTVRLHSLYCPVAARGGVYGRWWERPAVARTLLNRLDGVLAVTENVRRSLETIGVRPEKIESVPMCVDTQRFHPRGPDPSARDFPDDRTTMRLLFVGNASRAKGLAELLGAVRILLDKEIRVFLVAALENESKTRENGEGYGLAQRVVQRLHLEGHVRFLGLVDSIETLYGQSHLLVVPWNTTRGPSDYPMVVLEALAMGKCVVCTPVGGCAELLAPGPAGILTAGFSAPDLAAAIEYAVKNPAERERIERRALQRSREFSLTSAACDLLTLYENLLEAKTLRHVECGSRQS